MHLVNVIEFLNQRDEFSIAKDLLAVFVKYANTVEQYDELGMLFEKIKDYNESLKMLTLCYNTATEPRQLYSVRSNFAKIYNHLNEPLKSLSYSNLNLELNPNDNEMKMEQSFSYYLYGDADTSWKIQNDLLLDPTVSENVKNRIHFNMGSFDMDNGLFKQGMEKMILGGKKIGIWPPVKKPFVEWDGNNTDKVLLIYAEAGIGDQIIHIRFMHELQKRNIRAIWIGGDDDIRAVFKYNGFNVKDNDKLLDPFEEYVYTDSTSLSVLLSLEEDELWNGTYLSVNDTYVQKWKTILPEKFVTIRWSGNPSYDQDLHRKLPFDLLYDTIRSVLSDDIAIVSLQIDEEKLDVDGLINVDINDWFDTLAIQQLALNNITSCTSTVHSAGAIGANCIVLPPICSYYPWSHLRGNNSYWYNDKLKVIKQTKWKSWEDQMNLLKIELGVLNG